MEIMPVDDLFFEPEKFDIRACPIWAIPQIAELRKRVSRDNAPAVIESFVRIRAINGSPSTGRVVINIPDEGTYYGYINSRHMNEYEHPVLTRMRG